MGRLAHITRLALGRSPFGEPLRDENGDFILGTHAHDNDAPGYQQQYDDRGHPQNLASRTASRRLRKAQNDVLATIGVVVKKGEERKSKWEKLEDHEKWNLIYNENQKGSYLKGEDRTLGLILPWCITSLRKRLMTFRPYSVLPITTLLTNEYQMMGPAGISSGLPLQLISMLPQLFRYYICEPNVDGIVNFINPWREREIDEEWEWAETVPAAIRWYSATTIMQCFELPLLLHATLQSLHIVPSGVTFNWTYLIPFSASSPIFIPELPTTITKYSMTTFAISLFQSPLVLYFIRDYLHTQIGFRIYAMIRQLATKPDRPDLVSAKVSDESDTIEYTSIAGIGYPYPRKSYNYEKNKRFYGPKTFVGALRVAFPPIYHTLNILSGKRLSRSAGGLGPRLVRQLKSAVREVYAAVQDGVIEFENVPERGTPADRTLQLSILSAEFGRLNLNPFEELVDPVAWIQAVLDEKAEIQPDQSSRSQALNNSSNRFTRPESALEVARSDQRREQLVSSILAEAIRMMPVSDAIVIQTNDGPLVMERVENYGRENRMRDIHHIQASGVTRETLMDGVRNLHHEVEQSPAEIQPAPASQPEEEEEAVEDSNNAVQSPPTPTPGITRALSITDPHTRMNTQTSLRPLRRPTETDDSLAAISQTLRAEAENLRSPPPSISDDLSPVRETFPRRLPPNALQGGPLRGLIPMKYRLYRVTTLSNFAADSFAWHASAILTSLILWPFEALWLRSVANWALQNPAMSQYIDPWWAARLGFGVLGQPVSVLGLRDWFGGATDASGRVSYAGSILLTVGLEGMVRGACWAFGVWQVKRWREKYGWGQF